MEIRSRMAKEYLDKLSAFIEKATADYGPDVKLEIKHFFSGAALYAESRICISLTPVGLAMKLPEETREKLLKSKKALPLKYFPKAPVKNGYALFPEAPAKGGKALQKYAIESIQYVLTLPEPKKKK